MENKVFFPSELVSENFVYDKPFLNNKLVTMKIWYKRNTVPSTLFIQLGQSQIVETTEDEIIINIPNNNAKFYETLDKLSILKAKEYEILKRFNISGKINYSAIMRTKTFDNGHIDVLKFQVVDLPEQLTVFDSDKNLLDQSQYVSMLSIGTKVNIIAEVDSVILDTENQHMYTNLIARQLLLYVVKPQILKLSEYSFLEEHEQTETSNTNSDSINSETKNTQMNQFSDNKCETENNYDSDVQNNNYDSETDSSDTEKEESDSDVSTSESSDSESEKEQQKRQQNKKQTTRKASNKSKSNDSSDSEDVEKFLVATKRGKRGKKA